MKNSLVFALALKIVFIIFIVVLFFIGYNSFLLDKSLIALDASLQSLKRGDTLGVALLLNINTTNEIVKDNFNELNVAKLDYLGSTILERPASQDAQIILSDLRDAETKQKKTVFSTLDASSLAFKRGINSVLGFIQGKSDEQLKQELKNATEAHRNGDFAKAKKLYTEVSKSAGASRYGDIATVLLVNLENQMLLKEKRDKLIADITNLKDPNEILNIYFQLGLLELQLLDFTKAKDYFGKVLEIAPDSDLATKSKFYLGWANKQTGDFDESIKYFDDLAKSSKDEKFILSSKFEMADTFKRQGEFEKAAELFRDIARQHGDSTIASASLMFSKFTYLFDLKDINKANEITAELIRAYPGSELLESSREQIKTKEDPLSYLTKGKDELKDDAVGKIWSKIPVLGQALKLGEDAAAWYAVYMIEGSINQAIQRNVQKNEKFIVDVDPEFLTNYARKGMQRAASTLGISLSAFTIEFPKKDHIGVSGFVKIGPTNFKFYVLGKMSLEQHIEMDFIKGEYNPDKWIIFTILEGKLGQFKIPVDIANRMLGKAHRVFNQKEVFKIEEFSIMPGHIYFAGPLRFTQEELKMEKNLLDQYIKFYK